MPPDPSKPPLPFEGEPQHVVEADDSLHRDLIRPTALVHILTPEFHGFNSEDFADIPDVVVARASASELQPFLYWQYVPKAKRQTQEISAFSYSTPDEGVMSVALTPKEYDTASESVEKLAQRVFNRVLTQRDSALREETGDGTARARNNEDIRIAKRGAMRAVMTQQAVMERLLEDGILTKIQLIERFIEMTEGHNPNLARGTKATVSARFEELRSTVFDDMMDAVALQKKWSAEMTSRAKRIIQKRLYISGNISQKVVNFKEMLLLACTYYGHMRALMLTKIHDAENYQRANPEVVTDIMIVNEQRKRQREGAQLQFGDSE